MKTDRELLELAAGAYGLKGYIHEWINGPEFIVPGENPVTFNPLQDDGDALRLAVKLKFSVSVFDDAVGIGYKTGNDGKYNEYPIENCSSVATRRAIVCAAAQMQLNKEKK